MMNEQEAIKWQQAFKDAYKGFPKESDVACNMAISALEEIQQYREIGTVEECREAREKQIPKKPMEQKYKLFRHSYIIQSKYGKCPVCKIVQADDEFCQHCGQKLDWSEEE